MRSPSSALRAGPVACALGMALACAAQAAPVAIAPDGRLPPQARAAPVPDDSEPARGQALARLRARPARAVCDEKSPSSRSYGTACAAREFAAPAILEPPRLQWTSDLHLWGVWSPFLVGRLMLIGSCNNEGHGLRALDQASGRTVWKIAQICEDANRPGSMGIAAFASLGGDTVLLRLKRDDGGGDDDYVIDTRAGKVLRTLQPVVKGAITQYDGTFVAPSFSTREATSYLSGMNQEMSQVRWRQDIFRPPCKDKSTGCPTTFSATAYSGGILYVTANAKDQPEPPTRQLHAFDLQSGRLLWRHEHQAVYRAGLEQGPDGATRQVRYRSDDGAPMVADGRVVIRVDGLLAPAAIGGEVTSQALRALDARTGRELWTTESIPTHFDGPVRTQELGNHLAAGDMLIAEVYGPSASTRTFKEFLGYRMSDGSLAWRRPVDPGTELTASAGGVVYAAPPKSADGERMSLEALDAASGTRLWSVELPGHDISLAENWGTVGPHGGGTQGPSWRIGADGALYGVSLSGAFKLR